MKIFCRITAGLASFVPGTPFSGTAIIVNCITMIIVLYLKGAKVKKPLSLLPIWEITNIPCASTVYCTISFRVNGAWIESI